MTTAMKRIFIVAGEHSGDALGAKLMTALTARLGGAVTFAGVGGHNMEAAGLSSLYPLADITVMGPFAILRRLPVLVRRVYQTVDAALAFEPDLVVIVDAPEFTHPVAKRIRKRRPGIPIIDYVSPTVWAWRPGRAHAMAPYVDHVLALLPFEPQAHRELGGPKCTYVGHPLLEKQPWIKALDPGPFQRKLGLDAARPVLVVLPGSRTSEVERLIGVFGEAVARVVAGQPDVQVVVPAMPNVRAMIEARLNVWPEAARVRAVVISAEDEAAKIAAFKLARAALAASGTVALELALTRTPMVIAYRVDAVISTLRHLIMAKTCVLPNLITGERAVPEFLQEDCTPDKLAAAVTAAMGETPARSAQLAELDAVPELLALPGGVSASEAAAEVVAGYLGGEAR